MTERYNLGVLSEILVEKILKPEDGSLLHIAGSSVAGDLIKLLSNRGFQCSREVLYKTNNSRRLSDSTIADIKQNKIDAVMLYSPRSAEIFVELVRKARLVRSCQNIILICLSDAVYKKTLKIQWKEVKTSSEPNQGAIIKLVSILAGNSEPMHKNNKFLLLFFSCCAAGISKQRQNPYGFHP